MSARFRRWLPLLMLFLIAGPAAADATAPKPTKPPKMKRLHEPEGAMALVPLLPGMEPRKKSKIEVMSWTAVRGRKGRPNSWLRPERLRQKLGKVAGAIKVPGEGAVALHVLIPCEVNERAWGPEPASKKQPPLPPALMPCLETAVHPYEGGTVRGLLVVFERDVAGATRKLAKLGFGSKRLHSAMIVGEARDIVDLAKKLDGKVGLIQDPGRIATSGAVSLDQLIVNPHHPPSHKKIKKGGKKPKKGRKKPKKGRTKRARRG